MCVLHHRTWMNHVLGHWHAPPMTQVARVSTAKTTKVSDNCVNACIMTGCKSYMRGNDQVLLNGGTPTIKQNLILWIIMRYVYSFQRNGPVQI